MTPSQIRPQVSSSLTQHSAHSLRSFHTHSAHASWLVTYTYDATGIISGMLAKPQSLPWVNSRTHHFDCWDGRHDYAALSTPGGDIGEFILGLTAVEKTRPLTQAFTAAQVVSYFENYLSELQGKFYMHTDEMGFLAWRKVTKKMVNLDDPLKPETMQQREYMLETAPRYLNCSHLQLMMARDTEYKTRRELVEHVVRAVFSVLVDDGHAQRAKIQFVVLQGYPHQEKAIVNVLSPGPKPKAGGGGGRRGRGGSAAGGKQNTNARYQKNLLDARLARRNGGAGGSGQSDSGAEGDAAGAQTSPDGSHNCYLHAPMIASRLNYNPDKAVVVYHPRAVYEKRAVLATFFARREKQDDAWKWRLFGIMSGVAKEQLELSKKYIYGDRYSYIANFKVHGTPAAT